MFYALFGVIAGVVLGAVMPFDVPMAFSRYTAVAILVVLDCLTEAIRSQIQGDYRALSFVLNLVFYVILTAFFVFLGDKLNIDLYLGIVVVFVFRIVQNASVVKDFYLEHFLDKKKGDLGK